MKRVEGFIEDPKVRFGPFRVMRRTDGKGIVVDLRVDDPLSRTVRTRDTVAEAILDAKGLWEKEGRPPTWDDN